MKRNGMPTWLAVLLTLVGVVVLGPPVLGLLAGLIGLTIGLAAVALKLGVILLAVFLVVTVARALFGGSKSQGRPVRELVPTSKLKTGSELSLESLEYEAQERRDAEMRALDAELARTLQLQGKAL